MPSDRARAAREKALLSLRRTAGTHALSVRDAGITRRGRRYVYCVIDHRDRSVLTSPLGVEELRVWLDGFAAGRAHDGKEAT